MAAAAADVAESETAGDGEEDAEGGDGEGDGEGGEGGVEEAGGEGRGVVGAKHRGWQWGGVCEGLRVYEGRVCVCVCVCVFV